MAFKYESNTYTLRFDEGHRFHGLTMKVKSVPLGDFTKIVAMASKAEEAAKAQDGGQNASPDDLAAMDGMFDALGRALVMWDLEDEDGLIPATREGLDRLDFEFVMALVMEWLTGIGGVSQKLGKDFVSGGTSPVPPIPMPLMEAL